jgi:hypothetical protein
MTKPSASAMAKAQRYIHEDWGGDGGAIAETARLGRVASVDKIALKAQYGKASTEIARALVLVCKARAARE